MRCAYRSPVLVSDSSVRKKTAASLARRFQGCLHSPDSMNYFSALQIRRLSRLEQFVRIGCFVVTHELGTALHPSAKSRPDFGCSIQPVDRLKRTYLCKSSLEHSRLDRLLVDRRGCVVHRPVSWLRRQRVVVARQDHTWIQRSLLHASDH